MEDAAAIASARAGEVFGLTSLRSSIQDYAHNITRFLVISRSACRRPRSDKTTIVFTLPERAGRAVQGAERLRAARHRSDEARVAADSRSQVGVPLLRRPGRRRRAVQPGAGAPGRVRADAAHPRLVSAATNHTRRTAPAGRQLLRPESTRVSDGNGSNPLTTGPSRAPARAMLKAVGFSDADLRKPLIGVANTWIEIGPCNYHLRTLAADVKEGIRAAGGTPMEFNTVSISDGITMGTEGMKASLVSREVIADSIELVARGNGFDGLVVLVGCDKTIPGGIMALARLDVPGLILYGGSIAPGTVPGPRGDDPGRVRGGRRARGRPHDRPGVQDARGSRVSGRRRLRRTVHGEHDGDCLRGARHRGARQRQRPGDGSGEGGRRAPRPASRWSGSCGRGPGRARSSRAGRSRTRSPSSRRPADRPMPCCTCWRSRREAGVELTIADFDRISARDAAHRRPQAVRPLRGHRSPRRRRQPARDQAPRSKRARWRATSRP